MKAALEASGVEHELVENASWGHGFDEEEDDATVGRVFDRVIAFLDRHVTDNMTR